MTIVFDRAIGAPADVNELEYISALQQTDLVNGLRKDGSIAAVDIQLHLMSRYGLEVTIEQVERWILEQLAGSQVVKETDLNNNNSGNDNEDPNIIVQFDENGKPIAAIQLDHSLNEKLLTAPLDLAQLTTLLLLPELVKICEPAAAAAARGGGEASPPPSPARASLGSALPRDVNENAVQTVFRELLDMAEVREGAELTLTTLQTLLETVGETAWTEDNLKAMLEHARASSYHTIPTPEQRSDMDGETDGGSAPLPLRLTYDTFVRILTSDVSLYDSRLEKRASTFYQDAIDCSKTGAATPPGETVVAASPPPYKEDDIETNDESTINKLKPLKHVYTASTIDYTADTFGSITWAVLAWFTFAVFFFSYVVGARNDTALWEKLGCNATIPTITNATLTVPDSASDAAIAAAAEAGLSVTLPPGFPLSTNTSATTNSIAFKCKVANSVASWIVNLLFLSIAGPPFIYFTTLGNAAYKQTATGQQLVASLLFGIFIVVLYTVVTYFSEFRWIFFTTEKADEYIAAYNVCLILGILLITFQVGHLMRIGNMLNWDWMTKWGIFTKWAEFQEEYVRSGLSVREGALKRAATYKVRRLLKHAIECRKYSAVAAASDVDDETEENPSARAMFGFHVQSENTERIGGVWWTWRSVYQGTLRRKEGIWLSPRLIGSNLVHVMAFGAVYVVWELGHAAIADYSQPDPDRFMTLPEASNLSEESLYKILAVGAYPAFITVIIIALIFIPSYVSTVLRYRSGELGSLRAKEFLWFRFAQDQVTILFGSALWAVLFAAVLMWALFSGLVFLFMNPYTTNFFKSLLANFIGNVTTFLIQFIILFFLRKTWYAAFYRRHPLKANIMNVFMECWNLSLTTGFVLVRSIKLLLVTVFYIGRIDTPLLAPGVGVLFGTIQMDAYPMAFRKDLLAHEAHRHPFIERLAFLYLLKLRNGESFGTQAGAAWRILFTLVLMPWLRKYRVRLERRRANTRSLATPVPGSQRFEMVLVTDNRDLDMKVQMLRDEVKKLKTELAQSRLENETRFASQGELSQSASHDELSE